MFLNLFKNKKVDKCNHVELHSNLKTIDDIKECVNEFDYLTNYYSHFDPILTVVWSQN